jgi:signal transduction histidine kinase
VKAARDRIDRQVPPAHPPHSGPSRRPGRDPEPHTVGLHGDMWRRRGCLFAQFAGMFGIMVLLIVGGMGALGTLAFMLSRVSRHSPHLIRWVWIVGLGLSFSLPLLAVVLARRALRQVATPLADVMAAVDSVAEGDLSARVPDYGPGEFGRLARSFNRMAEELERSDRQRRNLTADVAHELRTPLHIIQGNLEGILDHVYEPTEEHISATLDEAQALARLVEDLRTLSLAEAGQLDLVREPIDVAELLADVCTSFSGQAEFAGIDLRLQIEGGEPLVVDGDMGRLDQVLGNLLSNALRYTPNEGTIALQAERAEDRVRIRVTDTGSGIPPEDLAYIFDRFWKGDRSRTRQHGAGSGLGLAIARQLVHAHGGTIQVESAVGKGTTFTIELPAQEPSP